MLIEVHYGDACVLLVNGDCRPINLLNYIRSRCSLSSSIKLDLCLINTGEPFHLSSSGSKLPSLPAHVHCILTRIDEDGTYVPLLNDPTLITKEFLAKLKRATTIKDTPKINSSNEQQKRRRSLKSLAMASTMVRKKHH